MKNVEIPHLPSRQTGLALFRLLLCFLIMRSMFLYLNFSDLLFGKDSIAPYERYTDYLKMHGLEFLKFPFELWPPHYYLWFIIGVTFLFALGIGKWFTGILLYVSLLNLHFRNHLILDGSDNIILVVLPFLLIADNYTLASYNVPRFSLERNATALHIRKLAALGFLLQICIVYFVTGMAKLGSELWFRGIANYYILQLDEFEATRWNAILVKNEIFTKLTTYSTLVFEVLFPFAMLLRRTKYIWLLFGMLFHLGIWVFMKIDVFPWIMMATYAVFITDEEYLKFITHCKKFVRSKSGLSLAEH